MRVFKLLLCIALLQLQNLVTIATTALAVTTTQVQPSSSGYSHSSVAQSTNIGIADGSAASALGSLYRKSRQSRCVRCYEDRYADDRSRGYGSYPSRPAEERTNWYYPSDRSNDRYDDRYRAGDRDYDRDDRYAPRTYDRYEARGYDRNEDRRGSYYDRGESRGYGYDNRDRYSGTDRYSDYYGSGKSTDRYYDRPRAGSISPGYGYDRDTYDRYYPSSPYGGRPARPLGGSYLLDRDSNVVSEAGTSAGEADSKMAKEDAANLVGGTPDTPEPAALTSKN